MTAHIAKLRAAAVAESQRRHFAGIGSPLHEAIVARFDASTVAELEIEAVARQVERERRSAERKAAKAKQGG